MLGPAWLFVNGRFTIARKFFVFPLSLKCEKCVPPFTILINKPKLIATIKSVICLNNSSIKFIYTMPPKRKQNAQDSAKNAKTKVVVEEAPSRPKRNRAVTSYNEEYSDELPITIEAPKVKETGAVKNETAEVKVKGKRGRKKKVIVPPPPEVEEKVAEEEEEEEDEEVVKKGRKPKEAEDVEVKSQGRKNKTEKINKEEEEEMDEEEDEAKSPSQDSQGSETTKDEEKEEEKDEDLDEETEELEEKEEVTKGRKKPKKNGKEVEVPPVAAKRGRKAAAKVEKPEKEDEPEEEEPEDDDDDDNEEVDSESEAEVKVPTKGRKKKELEEKPKKNGKEAAKKASIAPKNKTATAYDEIDFNDCTRKNTNGKEWNLKISNWNVDGIRAWINKGGLDFIKYEKPDIFCLQETKCSEDKLPEEAKEIDGYKVYWICSEKDGYAGVGLYSKKEPISVQYGLNDKEHDNEGRVITAEFEKFYVVSVYVPNSGRGLVTLPKRLNWNESFRKFVGELDKKKPVIVCGDMNVSHLEIDLANPKTNTKNAGFTKQERDGMTEFLKDGYVDTFREIYPDKTQAYTFWTYMSNCRAKNIGWRLDYFIVSERFMDNICDNIIRNQVFGSDHCPLTLFLNV